MVVMDFLKKLIFVLTWIGIVAAALVCVGEGLFNGFVTFHFLFPLLECINEDESPIGT